jgi:hypothetical protein
MMPDDLYELLGSDLVSFLDNAQKPLAHDEAQGVVLLEKRFYFHCSERQQLTGFGAEGVGGVGFAVQQGGPTKRIAWIDGTESNRDVGRYALF